VIGGAVPALARRRNWPYLNLRDRRAAATPVVVSLHSAPIPPRQHPVLRSEYASLTGSPMVQSISTPQQIAGALPPARGVVRAIVMAAAGLGIALLLGAAVLWLHYGTAVFFETIASGLSACF